MIDVHDLATRDVMTARPEMLTGVTPIGQVAGTLARRAISSIPIVRFDGRLQGTFSTRDLLDALEPALQADASAARAASLVEVLRDRPVEDVLSRAPTMAGAPEDPLAGACQSMVRARTHRLVIVEAGKVVGVLSAIDAVRALACLTSQGASRGDGLDPRQLRVRDVMSAVPEVLSAGSTVCDAAALLARQRLSGVPVIDDDGRLLGVISSHDLLLRLVPFLTPGAPVAPEALERVRQTTARECLARPAATCRRDEMLGEVCQRMVRARVHRLVAVEGVRPAGVLSAIDVVRALACLAAMDGLTAGEEVFE